MTPLRIVAVADVSPLAVIGGAERVLWEHVRRLARRGHDVRVLCRAAGATPAPPTVREGVEIVEFRLGADARRRISCRAPCSAPAGRWRPCWPRATPTC